MKGIISYGAYIPYNRLQRKKIGEFFNKPVFGGEKAIAGYDEDSVSMGVESAIDCLAEMEATNIDRIYYTTTSAPYKEKGSVSTITAALNLTANIHAIEAASSLRSGTSAIMAANESEKTLVITADCRIGAPTGQNEQWFGDGAASFLIGSGEDVIAEIVDSGTVQGEIITAWRSQGDSFTQDWEERLGTTVFLDQVKSNVQPFLEKNNLTADALTKVIISGPGTRAHTAAARSLGLQTHQIQDPLFDKVGRTGNAHAPMMMVSALESAQPNDQLLIINFAEGLDMILLKVTEAITQLTQRKGVKGYLERKSDKVTYSDYLKWRNLIETEPPRRPDTDRPSAPALYRGYRQNLSFTGSKCKSCGTPQFPKQRVCVQCQAKDEMEDYRFVGQSAKVTTFTLDHLAASPAPPMIVAVIDFEKGGRIICEVTDCNPKEIKIGMNVEMTFRRLSEAGGISNYFWKARPIRQKESS
ncbi:OB-fold domain-containing protein [Cytobacillus purgationiresistens]|uniref:3-hydroxy-3-methylglutaryl CoA synthase n=1 Tax=Cytobacillus purgationiresistens TaxID=863449 RepID=A0ABU0AHJ4_9BACI|nr:OB-fold domain-containing protein [Cytobacillus purgationiresistens]MDQ0270349.1 3-hydroxy-3-methylglutaryl CoA synthase [Cytobacillus purgationiresistens]